MGLVAVRAIQGLFSGLAYPSTYNLFNKWSSPEERATIMSIVFAGIPVAIIVNYPLSSALCESGVDGGWPLVFYIPGKFVTFYASYHICNYLKLCYVVSHAA